MHQHSRILLIEDDSGLALGICEYLRAQQIQIFHVADASGALAIAGDYDLILCDIMLPDGNGLNLLPQLQQRWSCPVLFLTALSSAEDQICGLEAGAADYLCKPIDPSLLLAKIRSCLRARQSQLQPQGQLALHDLVIDFSLNRALLAGKPLQLTSLEFDILCFFIARPGQIISRELLFQHLVGREYDGLDRAIDVRISRLRKHLEQLEVQGLSIVTVRGQGYLFNYLPAGQQE
ncbi:response regulator transcription factor [Rheinheimera soli]|uniref:DNA-binding response OmpR family regulator n=1 Tax=Rheinheimera soli TaxID=443616 RepID=A0ABU1W493_9GAMM|nr:response regulator transcription factor [Rheinheimera soli]MDR7122791.1 DNA-binding response OmpR family regulator [Rheinheimera soli]